MNYSNIILFSFFRYLQLLSIVPDDVGVLQKLGDIYENINDKQQAYHYYYEVLKNEFIFFIFSVCSSLKIKTNFSHTAIIHPTWKYWIGWEHTLLK